MTCPRSLIFSIEKINHHLDRLTKFYKQNSLAKSKVKLMYNKFKKLNADTISDLGLHEFLKSFIIDIDLIYRELEKKYFFGINQ